LLREHAAEDANKIAYTFLADGEREAATLTYGELDRSARVLAASLQERSGVGERAFLIYSSGLEFVVAFFGCLYAGIIAVPVYPPRMGELQRFVSILEDCQASLALTTSAMRRQMNSLIAQDSRLKNLRWVSTDEIPQNENTAVSEWSAPALSPDALAFLQYTSGSTSMPKGVMVNHRSLVAHLDAIQKAYGGSRGETFVSWLPVYHDMGLIGNVLESVYLFSHCILMSSVAFIQKPVRWLNAISNYKATVSGGPNFGLQLCLEKISAEERETLNLASWRVTFNGAEPVRADTLERFAETFAPCGFRKESLAASYGMAEAILLITCTPPSQSPRSKTFDSGGLEQNCAQEAAEQKNARLLVSCGVGYHDQTMLIVDPETLLALPPGRIGEIWVQNPRMAQGYWNRPGDTEATFHARLADTGEGPFLRTGDLGFLHEDELYITGRIKDLIIINGRNHYPQDIERTLDDCHPALQPNGTIAFSVEIENEERLVIVQEVRRTYLNRLDVDAVVEEIRRVVAEQHEVEVHAVTLVKPGSVPRTSSGKLQRRLCRQKFLSGELESAGRKKSRQQQAAVEGPAPAGARTNDRPMQFSLFYFSANEAEFQQDKYRLLLEGARIADQNGFEAIWVPERHFHSFGGMYPNPSVLASALAMITKRIRIRAGSVVLPLHSPIRVAEEWAVVDNLSGGRVDLALARGWNPNDFVLSPSNHARSREALFEGLESLQRLWKGGSVVVPNGEGKETEVRIYPLPSQKELEIWITCSGSVERFVEAGEGGWNVLTALLFQSVEELAKKITAYRAARARCGHDPDKGRVTLMLHTFMGNDQETVRQKVRAPFIEYLNTSVDLWRHGSEDLASLSDQERESVLSFAFERYYSTSALFGTPESCMPTIDILRQAGIDEIACLIDFGVDVDSVLESLGPLTRLREMAAGVNTGAPGVPESPSQAVTVLPKAAAPASSAMESTAARIERQGTPQNLQAVEWDPRASDNRDLLRWSREIITAVIADATKTSPEKIDPQKNFLSLGISSVKAVQIIGRLENHFAVKLQTSLLFEFPTIAQFAEQLVRDHKSRLMSSRSAALAQAAPQGPSQALAADKPPVACAEVVSHQTRGADLDAIAVIGLSCRFPGAPNAAAFWEILAKGQDSVTEVPEDHWDWHKVFDINPDAENKTYSRWGGFLKNLSLFDAAFFNISPREAKLLDPQQRLFLEIAWETFENAGYSAESLAGKLVGNFVGASYNGYYQKIAAGLKQSDHGAGVGNQNAIIANRVSFVFNLRGPSVLVDTLCSSSLVALHLACQSIRSGECAMALAGGVNILLSPENYVAMSRMKAHSPDGRCKPFDHRANGIVFGEGAGAVLLKPLPDALRDGDNVCAVIRGSAMNHGGQANGLLAPNPQAQAQVVRQALDAAGISADSVSYVEAHGTGTALGDPIEIEGLTKAYRQDTGRCGFCYIGSVKSNIGHLESAAGIAGIIKVILSMRHGDLPPTLHFEKANSLIAFEKSPFEVNTRLRPWECEGRRRAGISSFGIGGSNAHVILEEPPAHEKQAGTAERPGHVMTLSAKTRTALDAKVRLYADFLKASPQVELGDLCFTANTGRSHFQHRAAIVVDSVPVLQEKLERLCSGQPVDGAVAGHVERTEPPQIAFLFTGQGSQYANMGLRLYETEGTFREAMDRCQSIAQRWLKEPLVGALYSPAAEDRLQREPVLAQTALFSLEASLVELWRSWGVLPDIVVGHSLGEYVAAYVAGVFSLEDGMELVAERARLMLQHSSRQGAMAVIHADKDALLENLDPWKENVSIAAFNGPRNVVVSGEEGAIQSVLESMELKHVVCERLRVTHAFHSSLMDAVREPFEQAAKDITFRSPRIPMVSNLTGRIFETGTVPDHHYWSRHMREPVQFFQGIRTLSTQGCNVFLEIGPSASLVSMARRCIEIGHTGLPSLIEGKDDWRVLLKSVAELYKQGVRIDWEGFDRGYQRRRIPLPTYPFERKHFWLDGGRLESRSDHEPALGDLRKREEQSDGAGVASHYSPNSAGDSRTHATRKDSIVAFLRNALARFLETEESEIDNHKSLLEMGADSLVLIEAIQAIQQTFSIKVAMRQLFEQLTSLELLAGYLDSNLPQNAVFEGWPPAQPESALEVSGSHSQFAPVSPLPEQGAMPVAAENGHNGSGSPVERIMAQQLAAMQQLVQQQLAVLRDVGNSAQVMPQPQPPVRETVAVGLSSATDRVDSTIGAAQPWVPYQPWNPGAMEELPPDQQDYLRKFIVRYAERTRESKRLTQQHRGHHADLRAAMSFRLCTKEIRYPIIGVHSEGSLLRDVDGNRYVDFTMGYGVNLFGHNPPFIMQALREQMEKGVHVGPQSELAGEVAGLICEMTGMHRATFCNSGTEAVMAALRVARTWTRRDKIAVFAGSYHGTSDGVLVSARMVDRRLQAVPMVPGIPPGTVEDLVVLHYGSTQSLEILQKNIHQFAAVLVEPVQSRKPDLQPAEFLRQLRAITESAGVLLIFDETITGFRLHERGAQGWFRVEADLCTYGKVIGGGMPIGVLAGKEGPMSAIDGGVWQYGDSSVPSATTTLYTGTFCKHPLTMAAARATLKEIKRLGPSLFDGLNHRTTELVRRLNECCHQAGVPIEVVQAGSLFRLAGPLQLFSSDELDLLFYHLIHRGVYVWEGRNWFLSTAHTAEDVDFLVATMETSLREMREAGFLAGPGVTALPEQHLAASSNGHQSHGPASRSSSDIQRDLFLLSQADPRASLSYNLPLSAHLRGDLKIEALRFALETVTARHEMLRTVFSESGESQQVLASVEIDFEQIHMEGGKAAEQEWLASEAQRPLQLAGKPLWRARILTTGPREHLLLCVVHHLIGDGWSLGVLLQEISSCYTAAIEGREPALPAPLQLKDYQSFFATELIGSRMELAESYWLNELKDAPMWSLSLDHRRVHSHDGARVQLVLDPELQSRWAAVSSQLGATPFMTLLSVFQILMAQASRTNDIVVLVPVAGQALMDGAHLIGDCSNLMPVRTRFSEQMSFAECVKAVKSALLNAEDHEFYPLARLVRKLGTRQEPGRWPFFNIDRPLSSVRFADLEIEPAPFPFLYTNFDFALNITLFGGRMVLAFEYRTELFGRSTIEQWSAAFVELLREIAGDPGRTLESLPVLARQAPAPADPGIDAIDQDLAYVAPSTPVEEVLTSIWEQVLGLKRISVTASFFNLGGHSLLATQIISRVRETFGVQVSLEPMFLQPTITAFARHLEGVIQGGAAGAAKEKPVPVSRDRDLPLSFEQRRLWLIDQLETGNTAYNMIGASRLTGVLDMRSLEAAFEELIRRQESLRTEFHAGNNEPVQKILPVQPFRFEHVDLSTIAATEIPDAIRREGQLFAREPFCLSAGPLIRAKILKFGEKDHAIVILVHHIVSDGWSMGIVLREVGQLYQSFVAGKPSPLPELPIQFADYAVWQRNWLRGEVLQRQLDYWLTVLKGVPSFLNLPVDHPRLATPSFRGAHEPFAFTEKLSELLRQFCRQNEISPFMGLLAAFSLLLSRYSGQEDFVIGTDIANRNRLETEDLVGCFVNLLPLRVTVAGDPAFRDYVRRIRELTLNAYVHQDVPFDRLIHALRPERKLSSTPLVQVLFVLQNAPLPILETEELKMELVPIYMETAEFELILSIDEVPGAFTGTLGYSTDLFKRERIVAMISHLQALIEQIVAAPDQHLSSFSLFREEERAEFSNAGLTQKELETLMLRLSATNSGS
jgi:natural product biosynthesis luciferase-like monooxygenase protein